MNKTEITEWLFSQQDTGYADFQARLTPTLPRECFIGVRNPILRKKAKELVKEDCYDTFVSELPHKYYEENMLHGMTVSYIRDYDKCIALLDKFLPYVDNWAVCDSMSPVSFKKKKDAVSGKIHEWISSPYTYTCRFGMGILMSLFLDEDFKKEHLALVYNVKSDDYYVKMMQAWYFATALAKQWDAVIPLIENRTLDDWIHRKTIQKARESFRITDEQKEYLNTLK